MGLIAFDARSVRPYQTGLGRVAENLLRSLAKIDHENEYLVIQRADMKEPIVADPQFIVAYLPYDIASIRNAFHFGLMLQSYNPSVYHSLYSFLPFFVPRETKTIVTVHDFNWVQRPSIAASVPWKGWLNSLYGRAMHAHTVATADRIVCVSRQTRSDLYCLYPHVRKSGSVIHHGVNIEEFRSGKISSKFRLYGKQRFILSIGNGRPYKNPEGTLRAFTRLKGERRYDDVRLVIVGRGDRQSRLQNFARANGIAHAVDFLGMISDAELSFLLEHALVLSFPSIWEGFGLPVIEAFAFGCPVIASNVASLKEVAGDTAWMIDDPYSDEEIAAVLRTIINDKTVRQQLRERGLKRAKDFSWDRAAAAYLTIYKQMINETACHGPEIPKLKSTENKREKFSHSAVTAG